MQTLTDDIDFIKFLGAQESQYLERASNWTDEVIERLDGKGGTSGDILPWMKTHNLVALRPGEVSVWGGFNGHGKSQILNQVCAWGLKKSRWLIASMEMKPAATLHRMVRQVTGVKDVATNYARDFLRWTDDRLWIYDQLDTVKKERILGMIHYAAQELKINHIVIDSLMKCGIPNDDFNAQKEFIDRVCWAAKTENIHVHIVHHMRKGQNEVTRPNKHDFRGAGEITDLVDNVFIVHRNKGKEEKIQKGEAADPNEPDCTLGIAKQRHGEWEGVFKLWFHPESMQFTPSHSSRPAQLEFTQRLRSA